VQWHQTTDRQKVTHYKKAAVKLGTKAVIDLLAGTTTIISSSTVSEQQLLHSFLFNWPSFLELLQLGPSHPNLWD